MIGMFGEMEVLFQAGNGKEMIAELAAAVPEIVLLDLEMPEMDGRAAMDYLKERHPEVRVIVLSMHNDDQHIIDLIERGVRAYLFKDTEAREMENAIRSVAETGYYFNDHISLVMVKRLKGEEPLKAGAPGMEALSEREKEILVLICQEMTNGEIADRLHLSRRTVDGHRNRILQKTQARNTAGLVRYAIRQGIFEP